MPGIIDTLIVALRLDPQRQFAKDAEEAQSAQKRFREGAEKDAKTVEAGTKRQREAFGALKGDLLKVGAVLTAGLGLKEFATNSINTSAATGRLSRQLGLSTEELSAWQGAVRRAGGDAADAGNDLQRLVQGFQEIQLTGNSPLIPYLQNLRISLKDLEDPTQTLLLLADRFSSMDPRRATALGMGMGLSSSTISLLMRGRSAVTQLVEEQRRLAAVTAEDAEAAEHAQESLRGLEDASSRLGRTLLTAVLPQIEALARWLNDLSVNPQFLKAIKEMADSLGAGAANMRALVQTNPSQFLNPGQGGRDYRRALFGDLGEPIGNLSERISRRFMFGGARTPAQEAAWNAPDATGAATPTRGPAAPNAGGATALTQWFRSQGWSEQAARGIVAGLYAESNGNPNAHNPAGGGRGAWGIGQWRGKRLDDFRRVIGRDIQGSTLSEQLRFMQWELNNTEKGPGSQIFKARSEREALEAYITRYMRPAAGAETIGDLQRGQAFLNGKAGGALAQQSRALAGPSQTNIGTIVINTAATDAQGIARDIPVQLRRQGIAVTTSNTGQVW